jgi:predicted metal-dependent TIM-barrel fold hydrolase
LWDFTSYSNIVSKYDSDDSFEVATSQSFPITDFLSVASKLMLLKLRGVGPEKIFQERSNMLKLFKGITELESYFLND